MPSRNYLQFNSNVNGVMERTETFAYLKANQSRAETLSRYNNPTYMGTYLSNKNSTNLGGCWPGFVFCYFINKCC